MNYYYVIYFILKLFTTINERSECLCCRLSPSMHSVMMSFYIFFSYKRLKLRYISNLGFRHFVPFKKCNTIFSD